MKVILFWGNCFYIITRKNFEKEKIFLGNGSFIFVVMKTMFEFWKHYMYGRQSAKPSLMFMKGKNRYDNIKRRNISNKFFKNNEKLRNFEMKKVILKTDQISFLFWLLDIFLNLFFKVLSIGVACFLNNWSIGSMLIEKNSNKRLSHGWKLIPLFLHAI